MSFAIQSNSIRGERLHDIADRTIDEIYNDIKGMLGPGAVDAFITKDGSPYYTRDGKEVLESLIFDNELSNYVHHIMYQAAYHQGQEIGDGSTTLAVLYCTIYKEIREYIKSGGLKNVTINQLRARWKAVMELVLDRMKQKAQPLDEDRLLSMLYTCTQDSELAAKLFHSLKDPLMAGAYIVPRKSNIATDFRITTYNRPVIRATKIYSINPIQKIEPTSIILYCNGMLDIASTTTLAQIATQLITLGDNRFNVTFIILCHGVTEATRRSLREFTREIKLNRWNLSTLNNVAVYTMDDYRKMDQQELEDLATIITDEPGLGGMVNAIEYEYLLYQVFKNPTWKPDERLERFDIDPHNVAKMRDMMTTPYEVMFDDIEGLAIGKEFGPNATKRYNQLLTEISEEKSSIRKHSLNKRLRKSYGMFIDIEVGSSLMKDSQRKYELILDAIISGATAAKEKVVRGNSMMMAIQAMLRYQKECAGSNSLDAIICDIMINSLLKTCDQLIYNYTQDESIETNLRRKFGSCDYIYTDFTFADDTAEHCYWPPHSAAVNRTITETVECDDGTEKEHTINLNIMEPFGSIKAILTNSILPVELAMAEVFHISGRTGFMQNFIQEE